MTSQTGISERLVEFADGVGNRVLDVAAGYGGRRSPPPVRAARRAGDPRISAEMLAFGREPPAAGLGNVEFMESDASSLDFPHASFDAAVSRWGIIFEPDAEAAARRIRGFLKPGARIAISSWGEPDQVPFLSIPMRTTMERLDVPPPRPERPGPSPAHDSQESWERFRDETLAPGLQELGDKGLPGPPEETTFEVEVEEHA